MEYKRYFVTLCCDGKGYEYQNRRPLGQCIIERRGNSIKISIMVQDLKPETVYSPYIIFGQGDHNVGLPVGKLNVSERGKGELKRELDDAGGQNLPKIDSFCAVAVVVHKKDEFVAPLVGFKEEEVMWKNKLQFLDGMKEHKNTARSTAEEKPEEAVKAEEMPKEENPKEGPLTVDESPVVETSTVEEMPGEIAEEAEGKQEEATEEAEEKPQFESMMAEERQEAKAMMSEANPKDEDMMTNEKPMEEPLLVMANQEMEIASEDGSAESSTVTEPSEEKPEVKANSSEANSNEEKLKFDANAAKGHDGSRADGNDFYGNIHKETAALHESFRTMAQKFRKEMDELENFQFYPDGNAGEKEKAEPQTDGDASKHEPEPKDELEYIFSHNIDMTPFKRQSRPVKWVRISLREPVSLPINYQLLIKSPFVILAYKKYHHLILGVTKEPSNGQYILGIPGVYEPQYKGVAFNLGFTQFKCCDDVKPSPGAYGYWLMFIGTGRDHSALR